MDGIKDANRKLVVAKQIINYAIDSMLLRVFLYERLNANVFKFNLSFIEMFLVSKNHSPSKETVHVQRYQYLILFLPLLSRWNRSPIFREQL